MKLTCDLCGAESDESNIRFDTTCDSYRHYDKKLCKRNVDKRIAEYKGGLRKIAKIVYAKKLHTINQELAEKKKMSIYSTTPTLTVSTRLKNRLYVTPSRFVRLLKTKLSSKTVSNRSGASVRTVQEYRQKLNTLNTSNPFAF